MNNQERIVRLPTRAGLAIATALLAIAGALLTISPSHASADMPMHFTHLSIEDGLSQNNVQAMLQDSAGYMWFATESGLNRYDGYEIRQYHRSRQNPDGLANDFIWTIAEDANRDLWLATKGGGLVRWNRGTDTFTSFRHDPSNPDSIASDDVRTIHVNADGTIWVGTRDSGLDLLDPSTGVVRHYRHDPANASSISGNKIYAVLRDSRGNVWVGTDSGVNRLLPGSSIFQRYRHDPANPKSLSADGVRSIFEDSAGSIWIGTATGGINRLRAISGEFARFQHNPDDEVSLSDDSVRVIFEDSSRRMWIGTTKGLNLLRPEDNTFDRFVHEAGDVHSISGNYINSIYQDRSGLLWVGTRSSGVSKWNPRSWSLGPYAQPWLSGIDVLAFASDGKGTVWVGTRGAGLVRIDENTGELERYTSESGRAGTLSDDRVTSLLLDGHGSLWVGTMMGGLNRLELATGRITTYRHDPADPNSLGADGVMTLFEELGGRLWVGTYGGGVSVLDAKRSGFTQYRHDDRNPSSLSDDRVSAIVQTRGGTIWIGTFGGGLNRFDEQTGGFQHYRHDPSDLSSLAENTISALHEGPSGSLWVGTAGGGLDRIVPGAGATVLIENISREDGLPSNDIYGIQSDQAGHLWLSTNYGLTRLNADSRDIKTFHRSHGLTGEEFNYGAHHRGPDGKLYFGGTGGFNAFQPGLVEESQYAPAVVLTSFAMEGEPADPDKPLDRLNKINLDYNDRVVSLGFAALDFTAPAQNVYSYMLEGFNREWIDLGSRHHVTFTNLDPGNYMLHVRARTSDGGLRATGFQIPITKAAPPWGSSLAYTIYGLLAITVLLAVWRSHRRKLRREVEYSQRLERNVAERTEELEQRNHDLEVATKAKSQFLARMSHEIRTPMNGMLGMTQLLMGTPLDEKQRRFAQTIRSSSQSLLDIINDILDFSKIEAGRLELDAQAFNVAELVEETADLFAAAASEKGLELVCATPPGPALEVKGDAARLKQVLINLLANAIKFTPEGEVLLRYKATQENQSSVSLCFEVIDTGIGIKADNVATVFESFAQEDGSTSRRFGGTGLGLAICKQLVELMGGEIGVNSKPGDGSRFWFKLTLDYSRTIEMPSDQLYEFAGLRALVVDDNRTSNAVVSGYLAALGMQVVQAYTGDTALRQLHAASFSQGFDLMLLDAELRNEDSHKILAAIRRNDSLRNTRIVVMAPALGADEDQRWAGEGVNGYLPKPIRQAALRETLATVVRSADATATMEPLGPVINGGLDRLGGRVLLVEDNPVNQSVAIGILEEFGCDTVVALNGEDAIEQISREDFDVVLMDCEMPVMDGFTATAAIREQVGTARSVPIIAVTANAVAGDRERCLAAGMQDYLPKPITVEKLHGTLKRWLPETNQPVTPDVEALDPTSLDSIRNLQGVGGEGMVRRVVDIYLASSIEQLDNLRLSVGAKDAERVRQAAHALKASSQNVGAKPLSSLCQQLEEQGRNRRLDNVDAVLDDIDRAYERTVEALRVVIGARAH